MDGYIVRFIRMDHRSDEIYYYPGLSDAEHHVSLFTEDDSGLYQRIELLSSDDEKLIDTIRFQAASNKSKSK